MRWMMAMNWETGVRFPGVFATSNERERNDWSYILSQCWSIAVDCSFEVIYQRCFWVALRSIVPAFHGLC